MDFDEEISKTEIETAKKCVAEINKGKDEPDIYLKALECLGVSADESCIFEDSHMQYVQRTKSE